MLLPCSLSFAQRLALEALGACLWLCLSMQGMLSIVPPAHVLCYLVRSYAIGMAQTVILRHVHYIRKSTLGIIR